MSPRFLTAALVVAGLVLGGTEPASAQKSQAVTEQILKRLQELEAQVKEYRAETARLREELAKKSAAPVAAQPAPAAAKSGAADEWDAPEVAKKAEGRDEEARRRVLTLETQVRKMAGEASKREAEEKQKFKIDFSGKYQARLNSRGNFNLNNPLQTWKYDNATFFDHRFSLQMDATYEALLARLVLDKGNFVFDWKEDSEGTLERWGQFQTVNSQVVRELFVQYTGPFMLRAGRQNWDTGHNLVLEGPVDGVRFQVPLGKLPWGQTTLSAGYVSLAGGWNSYANFIASGGPPAGNRQELLGASNRLDGYYLDLDVRPSRSLRLRPYALKVRDRGGPGDADLNLDKDFTAATTPRDGRFQPLWTGLALTVDSKPWKLDAEAVLLTGDYAAGRKVDANALFVKATRDFGRVGALGGLSAGLEFGRGSGNGTSAAGSGTLRNFNALFLCRERHKFGRLFSEDIRAGYFFWDSNLSNITYVKADATLEPVKGLKVTPSATKVWATEEVFAGRGPVFDWSRGAATTLATTRDVGWEIGVNVAYPLYKYVEGFVSAGYFRPGAVYARSDGSRAGAAREFILGAEVKF